MHDTAYKKPLCGEYLTVVIDYGDISWVRRSFDLRDCFIATAVIDN